MQRTNATWNRITPPAEFPWMGQPTTRGTRRTTASLLSKPWLLPCFSSGCSVLMRWRSAIDGAVWFTDGRFVFASQMWTGT